MRKNFAADRSGAMAILMALSVIPLILALGFAVDYGRYLRAGTHLQELADAASLAAVASGEKDPGKLRALADQFIEANLAASFVDEITVSSFKTENNGVDPTLAGRMKTYFMGLASISELDVGAEALAVRAVTGSIELALVLDNTQSMETDDKIGTQGCGS